MHEDEVNVATLACFAELRKGFLSLVHTRMATGHTRKVDHACEGERDFLDVYLASVYINK